ncbi:MAG: hypothetical protein OXB84_05105 [Halobacteriovoraceae bacterium]|nr:hypothetical protein [Halobacteriovoraceae bacterium]
MEFYWVFIQNNLLAVISVILTLVLIYHYLMEKDTGVRISKGYRSSIFETQSKMFLNATQYLILGNKDLAIREFLNAVDLNQETIETYFALGGLFRSNGEIDKAISIHRSLMARENITESTRTRALRELAMDFDKGGFVDMAIKTYKQALKVNRDQIEVIQTLCRIFEDIEDWEQAYNYRIMLSKVGHLNQAETISHILVQKAKCYFEEGDFASCSENLDEAFRFAPSVSAKILRLKLCLSDGNMERAQLLLMELIREHPMYTSFIFVSLENIFKENNPHYEAYKQRLEILRDQFLKLKDRELLLSPSVALTKVRLLKERGHALEARNVLKQWMDVKDISSEVLDIEYIKLLIELNETKEAVERTKDLLNNLYKAVTKHYCKECGHDSDDIFWRCPQCYKWETIQFRWKV